MLRALIGLLCTISCLHSSFARTEANRTQPVSKASQVYARQREIIEFMQRSYPEVQVTISWEPCGEYNSYYEPSTHKIGLCTEMEDFPDVAVAFAAHEMGHAITDQMLDELSEYDADELAALALIAHDDLMVLLDTGIWFKMEDFQGHISGDPHPSHGYRAEFFACMGSVDTNAECALQYYNLLGEWSRKLITYR